MSSQPPIKGDAKVGRTIEPDYQMEILRDWEAIRRGGMENSTS